MDEEFNPYSPMTLNDLKSVVTALSPHELAAFGRWFEEYLADSWDQQIEADVHAGRLEKAGREADADFDAGRCQPL
jgi:hypothetical protein